MHVHADVFRRAVLEISRPRSAVSSPDPAESDTGATPDSRPPAPQGRSRPAISRKAAVVASRDLTPARQSSHPVSSAAKSQARRQSPATGSCSRAAPSRSATGPQPAAGALAGDSVIAKAAQRLRKSRRSVVTMPPSPVVTCFTGWKLKTDMCAMLPVRRPRYSAPKAWQASSITISPCCSASSRIASRSAGCPA